MTAQRLPQRLTYTPDDVAAVTPFAVSTVRAMCERGEIEAKKAGRRWLIPRREYCRLVGDEGAAHEDQGGDAELRRRQGDLRGAIDAMEEALRLARRVLGET